MVEVHGDAQMDRAVHDERVAFNRRVERRELVERVDDRTGDERQRGQPGAGPRRLDP